MCKHQRRDERAAHATQPPERQPLCWARRSGTSTDRVARTGVCIGYSPGIAYRANYTNVASRIGAANAPRAVGRAIGRNPISFVVPCLRVVAKSGALTGYHWGITRKQAMLGWEAGIAAAA